MSGGAGRRVLVLDDEPLVAMLLGDYLEALGHSVLASVTTAAEALAAIGRGGVEIALLDCDLGGGARSWAVADRLAEDGVPFLFSSGRSGQDLPTRFADRPMLGKPYTLASLEHAVSQLTD